MLRKLSALVVLVPGLLAVPVLTPAAGAAPAPVAPMVRELKVSGVDASVADAMRTATSTGTRGSLSSSRRPVLLTERLGATPFSLVGLTWKADRAVGEVEASVRTRSKGTWSAWQPLGGLGDEQPDPAEAAGTVRAGTSPLWVGDADGVQARLDVLSGAAPQDLRLSLVDPGTSAADSNAAAPTPLSTASAASTQPQIRSRAEWGADESIRRGSPSYASGIKAVVLHHTASSSQYTAADVPRLLRGFYAYHVKSNGWSDIGYNVLVDRFGRVWEGRHGGINKAVIGSHAGGFNTGTVGIAMIGTYETVAPSAEMRESVSQLAAWRMSLAGVNPTGNVTMTSLGGTKYPKGTSVPLPTLFGHRQVSATSCPGTLGFAALPGLRTRAAALVAGATPIAPPPLPTSDPSPTPSAPELGPDTLAVSAPASVAPRATVSLTVRGGSPGAAVQVWFNKRGQSGFTKRRDGVLSSAGTYGTTYVADDDYTVFATSLGRLATRQTVRLTTPVTKEPTEPATNLTIRGPVTARRGDPVLITATGPAGAPVTVWSKPVDASAYAPLRSGTLSKAGTFVTTYTSDVARDYFALGASVASNDASTSVGDVADGLEITAPNTTATGREVPVVVQGTPGLAVEVWFHRRGETGFTRRREGVLAPDGTYRTSYVANDNYTYFATAGGRSSRRVSTTVDVLPAGVTPPLPRVAVSAPESADAGATVTVDVSGAPGAPVEVWFKRRDAAVWSRLREARFDPAGRWSTTYAGTDDHEYWASSQGFSSRDVTTLTTPVLIGPVSAALGSRVELSGRARPGDVVTVESRRRGTTDFVSGTFTADSSGAFRTSYAADDEYEYRPVAAARVGRLHRTTVAPTAVAAVGGVLGNEITLRGTARPGSTVEVLFRRDSGPTFQVGGRMPRGLPQHRVGRSATADATGAYTVRFPVTTTISWFVRSDGNRTPTRVSRKK